jgi:N-acetylmuramoyl-L-alanine amidase
MDIKTMPYLKFVKQHLKKGVIIVMALLWQSTLANQQSINFSLLKKQITPSHIQLTLEANQLFHYKTLSLNNPHRIVFDIANGHLKGTLPKTPTQSCVTHIRTGQYAGKYFRLVFESKTPIKARTQINQQSTNRYQWIIDLYSLPKSTKSVIERLPTTLHKQKVILKKQTKPTTQTPSLTLRDIIVVIDPGHGGKDPGAIGRYGIREKDIVLQISKKLYQIINQQPGFKAVLTRTDDRYLTLRQRLSVARRYKPDLFIAIHADAYKNHRAKGASVFALSQHGATSEAARWLASRENQSELAGGLELSNVDGWLKSIMINLSQNASIRTSINVGKHLLKTLKHISVLHHNRIDQAAFVVLKSPDIPSLLIETGFISNTQEEKRLRNPRYQYQLAQAIHEGIKDYFSYNPSRHTWLSAIKNAKTYHVIRGDTLSAIANRYNTSVNFLMELNHLSSTQLKIGQQLFVSSYS